MSKEEAVLRYKIAMAVYKSWYAKGALNRDDLSILSDALARKYGLSLCSINLDSDLLCRENRANIPS